MRRRYDDEDEKPNWAWRLFKGVVAGVVVSGAAMAALSIFVLPPPAPPPATSQAVQTAETETETDPKMIDGIEVSSDPAYFGMKDDGAEPAEPADRAAADLTELSGPALVANAEPFAAAPEMPLVAVVLDDAASDPLLHERLFGLHLPVTVGVVAGGPGDEDTASAARGAGFEVVAQVPLAQPGTADGAALEYGMSADEAAQRTEMLVRRLPMAVAVTRPLDTPTPPDGSVLDGIMATLGPLGFAYLEHGLAPGETPAVASEGLDRIVATSHFTIPPGASAAEAHEALDRAAARAAESGASVVLAGTGEQVLLALQLWGGADAEGLARLAPLSAVIRRRHGADLLSGEELFADAPAEGEEEEATATAEPDESGSVAN